VFPGDGYMYLYWVALPAQLGRRGHICGSEHDISNFQGDQEAFSF
jgi:hypothetical protein